MNITSVNLEYLAGWIVTLGIIGSVILAGFKLLDKHLLKRISAIELELRDLKNTDIRDLKSWSAKQQADISKNAEARQILVEGQLTCLEALEKDGKNGPVTDTIRKTKAFLYRLAGETRSH